MIRAQCHIKGSERAHEDSGVMHRGTDSKFQASEGRHFRVTDSSYGD